MVVLYCSEKDIYIYDVQRHREVWGLNSHIRDNMDFQSNYQRKSIFFFFNLPMSMSLGWITYTIAILVMHGAGLNTLQRCWVWLRNHTQGYWVWLQSQTQQPYTLGVIPCYVFGQNLPLGALPCLPRAARRPNRVVDCGLLGTADTWTQWRWVLLNPLELGPKSWGCCLLYQKTQQR
jgi:hypothetical protein